MKLHLAGYLNWYDPLKRSRLEMDLPEAIPLSELLFQCGIPAAEVVLCVVNDAQVELKDALVADDDRVELYPPMSGG